MELNNAYLSEIRKYFLEDLTEGNLQIINYSNFDQVCGDKGRSCLVYSLNDGNVIKIPRWIPKWEKKEIIQGVINELENQLIALYKGMKTAEVFGIYYTHEINERIRSFGLAMKDLGRITLDNIENISEKKEAFKLWKLEREKLSKFGFRKWDDYKETNAIWVPEEGQTYLIDWGCNNYLGSDREKILNEIYEERRISV